MFELQGLKKSELNTACRKLGIHVLTKDTKRVLVEKLSAYVEQNPEDGLAAVQNSLDADTDDKEETDKLGTTHSEEEEDSSEEEEEDEEEEDDSNDKDYQEGPPVNLKLWVVDPIIEKTEALYAKVLNFTDAVGITTLEYNESLRERLSTTITLNFLELFAEACFYLYTFVPLTPIKSSHTIHPILRQKCSFLERSDLPIPDLVALVDFSALSVLFCWGVAGVVVPLFVSYYVNFSRRVVFVDEEDVALVTRAYKFDPFIFSLVKVLVYVFIAQGTFTFALSVDDATKGILFHLVSHFLSQWGIFGAFVDLMGNFPIILGIANVIVGLYSQFEEL